MEEWLYKPSPGPEGAIECLLEKSAVLSLNCSCSEWSFGVSDRIKLNGLVAEARREIPAKVQALVGSMDRIWDRAREPVNEWKGVKH